MWLFVFVCVMYHLFVFGDICLFAQAVEHLGPSTLRLLLYHAVLLSGCLRVSMFHSC